MGYAETYSAKTDAELQQLEKEKDSLHPEAAAALETELRRRGLQVPNIQHAQVQVPTAPYGTLIGKHRAFGLAAVLTAIVVIGAGWYGWHLETEEAEFKSIIGQMKTVGITGKLAKQRFAEIARRNTPTKVEYLQRCRDLEPALNDYESSLKQLDGLVARMQKQMGSDTNRDNMETAITLRSVIQKDLESVNAFRQEVAAAKHLSTLPIEEQGKFYDEQIEPIKKTEKRIAKDEFDIMKDAKARGVKFPEELYRQAGLEE